MRGQILSEQQPIKLWLSDADSDTLQQAKNLANMPGLFQHVALMPDAHVGYGMPIGGVAAFSGLVIPNAVGVDIGCGVCAQKTSLAAPSPEQLKKVLAAIRQTVPLGFNHHRLAQEECHLPQQAGDLSGLPVVAAEYHSARRQIGTLGGGNHFIELQQDQEGLLWLMIHSGSRNLGHTVAKHYHQQAQQHRARYHTGIPAAWQLDSLPIDGSLGQQYLAEMDYCLRFAHANRQLLNQRIMAIMAGLLPPFSCPPAIDIAHNYAAFEQHFGRRVLVHRKGAIRARQGEVGIIPGSQGAASFIVEGRGNPESFCSCAHGAGRRLGRKQAIHALDLGEEQQRLEKMGVLHTLRGKRDLEEAAGAYKDIESVMSDQQDLVTARVRLRPLAVIKG